MGQFVIAVVRAARGRRVSLGHEYERADDRPVIDEFGLDSLSESHGEWSGRHSSSRGSERSATA